MKTITKKIILLLFFLLIIAGESWGQYIVNFEAETKAAYASGAVTLNGISWDMTEALIGDAADDFKNALKSARMRGRNGSVMSMIQDKSNGIGDVTFQYRTYGTDATQQPWAVEYSLNSGGSWTQIGADITATGTVQNFSASVNQTGNNIRLRIRLTTTPGTTGNRRMNIDDINITNYTIAAPEINLQGNATNITDGDITPSGTDHTDFENVTTATTFNRTFTIQNTGTATLNITTPITLTGAGFSVVTQPTTMVIAGGSTTFVIRFTAGAVGAVTGNISITNDDSNENPYNFDILANSIAVPAPIFSFATATATIAENGVSINVTVNQSITNICSVNVALTGGTAVQGTDFTFTSPTTLNFNGVITSQVINIPIINNAIIDGSRTFILTLQTATLGCAIGTPTSITVTITDDEVAPIVGTIFEKGDIAIVAFNTNDNLCSSDQSDFITFICFKDIITGTTFDMTDNGWQRVNANQWGDSEGAVRCVYNGGATIVAGTKITFRLPSIGLVPVATNWSFADLGSGATVNMSSGGDQLHFMQGGAWNNPMGAQNATYAGGIILFGFNSENTWTDFIDDSNNSGIYPNTRCFITSISAGNYTRYTGIATATTKRDWIDRISNVANWTTYANCTDYNAASSPSFVITTGTLVGGKWIGDISNNWFDCKNWDDYLIPTSTTNVSIALTTDNSPEIRSTATYASEFSGIAQCNNITLANSTTKTLSFFATGTHNLEVYGNWDNQKGTANFTEGNGTVTFKGTAPQTISTTGGSETFANVILNNNTGLSLSNTNMLLSSNLTFTNGILTANYATTERVEFLAGSSVTGVSGNKYVNGWVRKVGNTNFTFPVGNSGYYAPIGISSLSGTATDHFTAKYTKVAPNPYNIASKVPALDHIDNCEYWDLNRTAGASDANVTLHYADIRSCGVTAGQESDMRVAHWNGTLWEDFGNTNTNTGAQTITSGVVSSFSPFTLSSISIFNPLPIELVSFDAKINQNNQAQLDWITVSELNAKGFEIEKSFDGKSFEKIGYQNALGGVDIVKNYQFFDKNFKDAAYYRLKMIDNDKSFKYSRIIYLNNQKTNNYELTIIPNPTQGEVKLVLGNALPTENVTLKVFSITGKEVISLFGNVLEVEKQLSNHTTQLPAGMYVVRMQIGEQILQTKLIKN